MRHIIVTFTFLLATSINNACSSEPSLNGGLESCNDAEFLWKLNEQIKNNKNNNAQFYYVRGMCNEKKGRFTEAYNDFTNAIEADANFPYAYEARGRILLQLKEYHAALDDFNKSLSYLENNAEVLKLRGNAYFNIGEYFNAIKDYEAAIRIYRSSHDVSKRDKQKIRRPAISELYVLIGDAFSKLGEKENAKEAYKTAVNFDDYNSEALKKLINIDKN